MHELQQTVNILKGTFYLLISYIVSIANIRTSYIYFFYSTLQ